MDNRALTKMQTIIFVVVIACAAIAGVILYSGVLTPKTEITVNIGGVISLTGPQAEQGNFQRLGFELAVQEINDAGGIKALGGARLAARIVDAGSTAESAVAAYNRLKSLYSLSGCVGCYGSALALAVTEQCERDKIPFITIALADILTGRGYNYTFDTSPKASVFGVTLYNAAMDIAQKKGVPFDNIGIVGSNAPSDLTTADKWENMTREAGLNLVIRETTVIGLTDATPVALKIKAANPDVLFLVFSSPADYVLLLDKLSELGYKAKIGPLMSGDIVTYPSVGDLGNNITDGLTAAVYTFPYHGIENVTQHLKDLTGLRYINSAVLSLYGQTYLYKEALERAASTDPIKVRDALSSLVITSGPAWVFPTTSPGRAVAFDSTGRIINATCLLVQWQSGIPYTIWPEDFAVKEPL